MDYEKKYKELIEKIELISHSALTVEQHQIVDTILGELKESEGEKVRKALIEMVHDTTGDELWVDYNVHKEEAIAWLEKQGSEPNWCHHKVDLSNCSEEYRKAYYDGWNNCNQQHSQCKSESNDVVKCLINGMKFYYEDNKEATWGTEKFSMKVKDILSWLEKQGEQKPAWTKEDDVRLQACIDTLQAESLMGKVDTVMTNWLKSLKTRCTWKPSDEQLEIIDMLFTNETMDDNVARVLRELEEQLKKLREE